MRLEDCTPGQELIIGVRYWALGLGGYPCTVLDTRPAPARPEDNELYPNGMVQVRLPDCVEWPCREPWFDPSDLAVKPGTG
jgi:hypothetical protein